MKSHLAVVFLFVAQSAWADPLSKEQLLDLLNKGVDPELVLSLVQRDCVTFDVDAALVVELSPRVPTPILQAAMDCRKRSGVVNQPTPSGDQENTDQPAPALTLSQIKTITVIPFTLDGATDEALTSVFAKELGERKPGLKQKDALSLQLHFEGTQSFDSKAPLLSLLKAARAVGVDAFFIGTASTYLVMGAPGVRLDVKLVETRQGQVLWSAGGGSRGGGLSWQHARGMSSRAVLRQFP